MKAIDRVMVAYAKTHKQTDAQNNMVRLELSFFIDQLLDGRQPERLQIKWRHPRNQTKGADTLPINARQRF
jgi:hypothetical protein